MFSWFDDFFYHLTRDSSILGLLFHRQSFVRRYVFDNWYFAIFTHILFYITVRFAICVARKLELFNAEKMKLLNQNKTRYAEVAALKDKKSEYEDTVIKVKESQVLTTLKLLNTQLGVVQEHLVETDKKLDQVLLGCLQEEFF